MAFNGHLLEIGGENFPLKYVYKESYNVTPNRVQDLDPYTTESGYLVRNPVEHEPSTISFQTKPMWNEDMAAMMAFIRSKYLDEKQRSLRITYYCPDIDDYQSGDFYFNQNQEFSINIVDVERKRILYNSMQIDFVEY